MYSGLWRDSRVGKSIANLPSAERWKRRWETVGFEKWFASVMIVGWETAYGSTWLMNDELNRVKYPTLLVIA